MYQNNLLNKNPKIQQKKKVQIQWAESAEKWVRISHHFHQSLMSQLHCLRVARGS
jgi:hypothetical protein